MSVVRVKNSAIGCVSTEQTASKRDVKTASADKGGWPLWYIELYQSFPCVSREELTKREGEVQRDISTLNTKIEGRTPLEYRQANAEVLSQYNKDYYQSNKEAIYQQKKDYYLANAEAVEALSKKKKADKEQAKQMIVVL